MNEKQLVEEIIRNNQRIKEDIDKFCLMIEQENIKVQKAMKGTVMFILMAIVYIVILFFFVVEFLFINVLIALIMLIGGVLFGLGKIEDRNIKWINKKFESNTEECESNKRALGEKIANLDSYV